MGDDDMICKSLFTHYDSSRETSCIYTLETKKV